MNIRDIRKQQEAAGYDKMQNIIETGMVWHMEGAMGREAMELLRIGACFLPSKAYRDAYGNRIPSRNDLAKGSLGTLENAIQFYNEVLRTKD